MRFVLAPSENQMLREARIRTLCSTLATHKRLGPRHSEPAATAIDSLELAREIKAQRITVL